MQSKKPRNNPPHLFPKLLRLHNPHLHLHQNPPLCRLRRPLLLPLLPLPLRPSPTITV